MKIYKNSFLAVLGLILAVSAALAYVGYSGSVLAQWIGPEQGTADPVAAPAGIVSVRAHLVQNKVLRGSDGLVSASLTLDAAAVPRTDRQPVRHADLAIVLDRSGSMTGRKLNDARQAVVRLIDQMSSRDRLAVILYSNDVQVISPLTPMDDASRQNVKSAVARVTASGGTNLGGGLNAGIQALMQTPADGRQRRVILISDGQANQGVTDPPTLGAMASRAAAHQVAVSTVGVGNDFNELLMTTVADHGTGSYYFLEDPERFASVFDKEFQTARSVAASSVEIRVPLGKGVKLLNAGGYPIQTKDDQAVIRPGDLISGQQRNLFLTFQVPTDKEADIVFGGFQVKYLHGGAIPGTAEAGPLTLACVTDPREVTASIDASAWSAQVLQEDYGRLREEVAEAISKGEKDRAMDQIREYETRNQAINAAVGSAAVAGNLDKDVRALKESVEDTFAGAPAAVAEKKKQNSKALQYESYQIRRDKK